LVIREGLVEQRKQRTDIYWWIAVGELGPARTARARSVPEA
jgi:hypothetical protein